MGRVYQRAGERCRQKRPENERFVPSHRSSTVAGTANRKKRAELSNSQVRVSPPQSVRTNSCSKWARGAPAALHRAEQIPMPTRASFPDEPHFPPL